ncbi:hypothetical protein K438DRAFT_880481 [Mycena galopus ATCC 62051]|nr:hypothetical protein K438DRAFT_880481 [Mycena galopus ATCC 62051]
MPIQLGSIRHIASTEYENSLEIAFSANLEVIDRGWSTEDQNIQDLWKLITPDEGTSILENGWICVNSACVAEEYSLWLYSDEVCSQGWLAQACHIFNSLDIKSNLEDYGFVSGIKSCLHLLGPIENLPPGYLFLCPLAGFETDLPGFFATPGCTAYWSVDPSGAERLSVEEARTLGLPDINSWMEVSVKYWDRSDYDGICQFHEAKGFDPYSQDVAIELGYPLFQVSCQWDDLFAHLGEVNTEEDYSESDGMFVSEDHESITTNAEDVLDVEISSNFNSEMSESLAVIEDVEIVKGRISGDLDGDNQVHEEANVLVSDLLEEEEVFAMLYC